jgi:hypothetical protein
LAVFLYLYDAVTDINFHAAHFRLLLVPSSSQSTMLPQFMFSILNFAASKGLAEDSADSPLKQLARKAGVRGETYAYWYLRREGDLVIARNFTISGIKSELDLVAYDDVSSPSSK